MAKFKTSQNKEPMRSKKSRKFISKKKPHKIENDVDVRELKDSTNDSGWYYTDEQMKKDIARFPFSYAAGKSYSLGSNRMSMINAQGEWVNATVNVKPWVTIPGAMVLYTRPALPVTDSPSDAVNQAGFKIVSYLKHTLSGSLPYEGPDVMAMLISMAGVYSYINFASRLYALPSLVSNLNRFTPQALIASMGVDPTNFLSHLADFRKALNQQIRMAASLAVPANIKYFARTAFMYSNIYTEGTAVQDQLYYFSPAGFWKYNEVGGAHCEYSGWMNDADNIGNLRLRTWDELIEYGNSLLKPLLNSDDVVLISANILRAYGDAGILKLTLLPDETQITPIFDIAVLEQIANANILGQWVTNAIQGSWTIKQKVSELTQSSRLYFEPFVMYKRSSAAYLEWTTVCMHGILKKLVNTQTAFTTEDLILESTRLKFDFSPYDQDHFELPADDTYKSFRFHCATEVVTRALMLNEVTNVYNGTTLNHYCKTTEYFPLYSAWYNSPDKYAWVTEEGFERERIAASFKFRPALPYIYRYVDNGIGVIKDAGWWAQLDNFTIIDHEDLKAMNEAITFALFNISVVSSAYKG